VLSSAVADPVSRDRPAVRDWLGLGALLVFAGALRAFAWSRTAVLFNDGPIFLALAQALREGRFGDVLAHPQHPLYPALVAGLEMLALPPEAAAIAVSIAGVLLAVAALFWMAWARFGRSVAWISAWVVALHPWAVDFSADVMSDGLYAGLYLASFAVSVELLERPTRGRALAFGLLSVLAYWTRPEGLVLAAVAVVGLAGRIATARTEERRKIVVPAGIVLIACMALAGGFVVAERHADGDLALSQKKSIAELAQGGPTVSEIARDRRERRELRRDPHALPLPESSIRIDGSGIDRPERSFAGFAEAVARVVATSVSAFRHELLLFALIGACSLAPRGRRALRAFDAVLVGTLLVHSALLVLLVWGAGYVSRRHALAAWLPLTVYSAFGWSAAWNAVRSAVFARHAEAGASARAKDARVLAGWRSDGRAGGAAVAIAVVVLLVSWGPRDLRARRSDRELERVAAEWLKTSRPSPGPVAAQKRRTAYYAGAAFVPLPDGRDGQIERQIRGRGARWLVIDAAKLADHAGLADGIGTWLVPVHTLVAGRQSVLVFEVTTDPAS
jgi:hypothetical protein